jgi:hypothetical protein
MGKKILMGIAALGLTLMLIFIWALLSKVDLLLNLVQAKPVAPTSVSIGDCQGSGYCLKFKHESELSLPPVAISGCEPYRLPDLAVLPRPSEIQMPEGADLSTQSDQLLKYIEKVLDTDAAAKAALLKHYQDYLDSCSKAVGKDVVPSTSVKTN